MGRREPLTEEERERIYRAKLEGKTLEEAAAEVGCSPPAPASGGGEGEMKG